ncbi:MAG TPA: M23 family metallopeptidase [Terracidiphilus sp.]|nr:M23 family metallopeptidase [Terracidiphilus sp.]
MTGFRLTVLAIVACLAALSLPAQSRRPAEHVTLTPGLVEAGSPELIRVRAPQASGVDGEWLARKINFFRSGNEWVALAGVDVEAPVGPSTLHLTAHTEGGPLDLSLPVEIHAAHYRTGSLSVAPEFVQPPPEAMKEIEEEVKLKAKVFASSAPEPLWSGTFRVPVSSQPTDSFGTRRMFNGKLASVHKGADFHAAPGTPVHASNSGVVVLARHLYYEGNCVVIDHGMGLFTLSMHFSRIDVHEGQRVKKGDLIGLSGATGRVTGPHLHWAVRWEGAYLDPLKLLKLDLNGLR